VLVEDALFATLDPTVRKVQTPSGRNITVTDTVGFVRHLPHELIEAFRSTLEEISQSDLLLHILDGSDPAPEAQLAAVKEVLSEIGASSVTELVVINKIDIANLDTLMRLKTLLPEALLISAQTGEGIDKLLIAIDEELSKLDLQIDLVLPYSAAALIAKTHNVGQVTLLEHTEIGTRIVASVPAKLAVELKAASV
jgi:GTP-binding protein HflX